MRAVVCHDFDDARVEEVGRPEPDDDELLLKTRRVQLSVTECNLYRGKRIAHYDQVAPRIEEGDELLFGHEFCADVVEVGPGVERFSIGDRVYAPGKIPCGECAFCRAGQELGCQDRTYIGYERPGATAEYFTSPAAPLAALPDDVSDAEGAAMQPLASSVVAAHDAGIATGDVVAVVGSGVMGSQLAQLAHERGADAVYAIDVDETKLGIAADNGLEPIDATQVDPVDAVRERTDGVGADVVVEAVGGEQSDMTGGEDPLAQMLAMVRTGGTMLQIGHVIGDVTVEPRALRSKDVDWVFPRSGATYLTPNTRSGEYTARLVADGRVSIEPYTTHEFVGLERFDEMVDVTLNKPEHGALGAAQLVLAG
jgi:threonine dehydrogenase-like Zn-dependent dehydrogenase